MRTLRPGRASAAVASWQRFLKDKGFLPADFMPSRVFDEATEEATKKFQASVGLPANASVGPKTTAAAIGGGFVPPPSTFEIGPDRGASLAEARPYFLVPVDEDRQSQTDEARARIVEYAAKLPRPVTDIYVISHGWHRNFFDAIAAYDRLSSRLALLMHRRRIKPPKEYCPLFLNVHWHSDPGEDNWVDPAGRRDKANFMSQAQSLFEPISPEKRCFVNDFEDIFELFSRMSAPGTRPLSDGALWGINDRLSGDTTDRSGNRIEGILESYKLADMPPEKSGSTAPPITPADKVAIVWKCYEESQPKRVLVDQSEKENPGGFMRPARAASTLANYVLGVVSLGTLLGGVWALLKLLGRSWNPITALNTFLGSTVEGWLPVTWPTWIKVATAWLLFYVILYVLSRIYLEVRARSATDKTDETTAATRSGAPNADERREEAERARYARGSRGLPLFPILAVIVLEFVILPVILVWLVLNYFVLGSILRGVMLFDERIGRRGDDLEQKGSGPAAFKTMADEQEAAAYRRKPIERFAESARTPLRLLRASTAADSLVNRGAGMIDKQLAFFEMQRKGVKTGRRAAAFIDTLWRDLAAVRIGEQSTVSDGTRIHLLGHSFGGLVVANAARHLTLEHNRAIQSVCLVQGAMASCWFERESTLIERTRGVIGCIYSRYDVANSFIYPVGNQARLAAGAVGLAGSPSVFRGRDGEFASLPRAPVFKVDALPSLLNADASRIIYDGPPLTNGGHDDIFKDDVVNLMWAMTTVKVARLILAEEE